MSTRKRKKFYAISTRKNDQETVAEIRIYDEIGFWGVTAKDFVNELNLAIAEADKIVVSINSPGGNVFDAFAIYNALRRANLPIETRADGVAASAASLIFMAGDERVMPDNAMLMIHNAWTVAAGTAADLRKTADMMDKVRDGIVAAYTRSEQGDDEIIKMMDEETWMSALEAQALGFCTLIEKPVQVAASISANAMQMLERLEAPQDLIDLLAVADNGDGAAVDEPELGSADDSAEADDKKAQEPVTPAAAEESEPVSANTLIEHVFAACRESGIPQLSNAILLGGVKDKPSVSARVKEAEQIAMLCSAAKLSEKAADFITSGLSVEQVRARLFDAVVASSESVVISNLQRDSAPPPAAALPVLNSHNIYAARAARK